MKKITLGDYAPIELQSAWYDECRAFRYVDVKVIREVDGTLELLRWPGSHKNVYVWWVLENGYMVGWNENPSRGWSFPVVKTPKGYYNTPIV